MFFREFCDIFINSCCYITPPVTASVYFLLDGLYFSLKPITHDVIWICYSVSPCSIAFIANRDNKDLDSELTMIFESKHILRLDTSWNYREENNQNLGKDILTEHTDKTFECASPIAIYYLCQNNWDRRRRTIFLKIKIRYKLLLSYCYDIYNIAIILYASIAMIAMQRYQAQQISNDFATTTQVQVAVNTFQRS